MGLRVPLLGGSSGQYQVPRPGHRGLVKVNKRGLILLRTQPGSDWAPNWFFFFVSIHSLGSIWPGHCGLDKCPKHWCRIRRSTRPTEAGSFVTKDKKKRKGRRKKQKQKQMLRGGAGHVEIAATRSAWVTEEKLLTRRSEKERLHSSLGFPHVAAVYSLPLWPLLGQGEGTERCRKKSWHACHLLPVLAT